MHKKLSSQPQEQEIPATNSYDHLTIEPKWQAKWQSEGVYQTDTKSASKKFYNLMMFPYPSAEGLHVGNMYAFTGTDIYGRFQRMQGHNVLEPIGLDGFGIHSENYAMKVGRTPQEHAKISEANFYRQLALIGNGFSWENRVETYDPEYYKWTQWLFIELFKAGLAYRKKAPVNFCPSCKTVLADEQVIDGHCERCNSIVEKRNLEQWFFKITDYAERLLKNIPSLDWSEKVKIAQTNWIGKKTGMEITYQVENSNETVTVFTTRPDTNFGATFIALAPENPLVKSLKDKNPKEIEEYIRTAQSKSDAERMSEGKEKTGVFTGYYAINQLTGFKMPIWVSDFVLMGFGTGAVVGVPGHDRRDFDFARKFNLNIIRVVVGSDGDESPVENSSQVQEDEGTMVNSDFLNGMEIHKATEKIMEFLEQEGYGKAVTTYHLRDWLISRQRYWGPPIPMIYCKHCAEKGESWFTTKEGKKIQDSRSLQTSGLGSGLRLKIQDKKEKIGNWKLEIGNSSAVAEAAGWYPEENLPVLLPDISDFKPGEGESPLARHPSFYKTTCPHCGNDARRETDVSDTFLDSSWYFLRYPSADVKEAPFDPEITKAWLPVDSYIGGAEHSVLHLLYSRFVTMVLSDLGYLDFEEPFKKFRAHGLIIKDGAKMSKSKGNVVVPDEYINKYGADTLRTYLMFLGPYAQGGDFADTGIEGMYRFLNRVWKLFSDSGVRPQVSGVSFEGTETRPGRQSFSDGGSPKPEALAMMHKTVKAVTEEVSNLRYNTAIAHLMTYYNFLSKEESVSKEEKVVFLKLLAPFAPHMTEELWAQLGETFSIHTQPWPKFDESKLVQDNLTIVIQVNGKLRGEMTVSSDEVGNEEDIKKMASENEKVAPYLEGKSPKIIYVPGKVVNFVVTNS